jgi:hypothetical protein
LRAVRLVLILVFALTSGIVFAQSLSLRLDGAEIRFSSSRIHFLTGEALDRLRDGATVHYEFQLTLRTDRFGKAQARSVERFAVSYDLWEEKFAITKLGPPPRSVSNLRASAAEAWCLDNLALPSAVVGGNQEFWIRVEYRSDEPNANDAGGESGFTLSSLVDIFSRRSRRERVSGYEEAGPFRLDRLKRK